MKFTRTLALCAAPLTMAKAVHNVYPATNKFITPRKQARGNMSPRLTPEGLISSEEELVGSGQLVETQLGEVPVHFQQGKGDEIVVIWVNPGAGAQTTIINNFFGAAAAPAAATAISSAAAVSSSTTAVAALTTATAAAAAVATHQVTVGGTAGLVYTPSSITAAVGDMVVFTFMSTNHTVTQSTFATPCDALAGGMDSGFQPNANNAVNPPPQVAIQVNVTTPVWFYCAQNGHCGKGMVFSINPTATNTQAAFEAMAIAQNGTTAAAASAAPAAGDTNSTTSLSSSVIPAAASSATGSTAATAAAAAASGVSTGTGTLVNGQCICAVTCAANGGVAAANAQVQSLGAFGGMAGSLPMADSVPGLNAAAALT